MNQMEGVKNIIMIINYYLKVNICMVKEIEKELNIIIFYLLFEGEFKHGKRYGKGNEYNYFGELIFEGEYLHGKRNGRGKEYNGAGELKFEGEYLNGKKLIGIKYDGLGNILYKYNNANGKGKEFTDDGILKFEGEFLNGKRNRKGKEYYDNGQLNFEGEYLDDEKWEGTGYLNDNELYKLKNGNGLIKEYESNKLEF